MIHFVSDRLRLNSTVLFVATVHFIVDGYGNIFAPLLPLLIPKLGLSFAEAGTLTMLFQLSASVSQVGFGHLADRWRPRLLLVVGPIVSVAILSFVGASTSMLMAAVILIVGGLGGAAFHPPAAALAYRLGGERPGLAMSVHITGGSLGFSLGPLLFAPFAQRFGLEWTPFAGRARTGRGEPAADAAAGNQLADGNDPRLLRAAPLRASAGASLLRRGAADDDIDCLRDVHAGDADEPRHVAGCVWRRRRGLPLRQRHRRISRRAGGGSLRPPARHRAVARPRRPVPLRGDARRRAGGSCCWWRSAGSFCSPRFLSTSRSARRWRR